MSRHIRKTLRNYNIYLVLQCICNSFRWTNTNCVHKFHLVKLRSFQGHFFFFFFFFFFFLVALQYIANIRLLNGILPVSSVSWPLLPVFNFAFISICFYTIPSHIPSRCPRLIYPFPLSTLILLCLTAPEAKVWFLTSYLFFTVTGCRTVAQPPTRRVCPPYL